MYSLLFPIIGGLLAWFTIYLLGFKKQIWTAFLLGLAIFFLAMLVQSPIQQLPLLAMGIMSNQDVLARGLLFTLATAIWLGFVAGLVQEGFKYVFIRGKDMRFALFVGLGFGITEVVMIVVNALIAALLLGKSLDAPPAAMLLSLVERYFAVLFHIGTTIFLAYAYNLGFGKRGLVAMVAIHTVVDSLVAYYQLTQNIALLYILEGTFAIIAALLIYYTIPKTKMEISEPA